MTKIEDALNRLRRQSTPHDAPGSRALSGARSSIPVAGKKKVVVEGERHHVSEVDLVQGGLLAPVDQASSVADQFRRIKRPLIGNATNPEALGGAPMNVIMIASAMPGAGKTFCAVNLAVSISLERELNVLLVDADVPKPHISRAFGLAGAPGLIDALLDEQCDVAEMLVRTDLNDIQVLPAGRGHPQATELIASERMSRIVRELASRYPDRIILLDSPPLLMTTEAQALASQVGQIALIVEAGKTTHQMLNHTFEVLDENKAINLILNKARYVGAGSNYGGEYGYYGQEKGD